MAIEYRSFVNTDTPLIAEIWRRQRPMRAVVDSFDRSTLDTMVLAKPYFDRHGLIMAVEDDIPLGFVHAGFSPNDSLTDLDRKKGVVSQLRIVENERRCELARELLSRAISYLRKQGARQVHFGGTFDKAPFYLGLYGGARLCGALDEDEATIDALRTFGFADSGKVFSFSRTLSGFRVPVNRKQMSVRREFNIIAVADPIETSWWESCSFGLAERDCFHAVRRDTQEVSATVKYWDIQPLATKWGVSARGLHHLEWLPEFAEMGLGQFLIGESLRHLMRQGIGLVEVQCRSDDATTTVCLESLGFERTGEITSLIFNVDQ